MWNLLSVMVKEQAKESIMGSLGAYQLKPEFPFSTEGNVLYDQIDIWETIIQSHRSQEIFKCGPFFCLTMSFDLH